MKHVYFFISPSSTALYCTDYCTICAQLFNFTRDFASENIVGYQTTDFKRNKNYQFGVQFRNVDGNDLQLNDIVVHRKDTGDTGDGDTLLWVWLTSSNRYTQKFRYWANPFTDDTFTQRVGEPAWGDENMIATNFTFKVGEGFWIKSGLGGISESKAPQVLIAGEVFNPGNESQYYAWEIKKNKNYIFSNPFPGDFSLDDVVVYQKDTGATGDGETLLWFWDTALTRNISKLRYWDNPFIDATFTERLGKPGWGDENMIATNIEFTTAQGFWIKSGLGGLGSKTPMIRFKNPLYQQQQ